MAELACRKAMFQSLELALDYIYGHDPQNLHQHPFVPFKMNEREIKIEHQNFAEQTQHLGAENLLMDMISPGINQKAQRNRPPPPFGESIDDFRTAAKMNS